MNTLKNKLKKKQEEMNPYGLFKNEEGAIDLSSIMVGIIVIGLIGGVIAATVFSVIPWAQDNAAKQQLESVVAAENAYMGLSSAVPSVLPSGYTANSFGNSTQLDSAALLKTGATYCVTTSANSKTYTAFAQSGSGKVWSVTDSNSKPVIHTGVIPTDCQFIIPADAPYVDATPQRTIMTYRCDTDLAAGAPNLVLNLKGTATWNDGLTNTLNGAYSIPARSFAAGVTYTVTFDGTYNWMRTYYSTEASNLSKCLRSVDHIGSETGLTNMSYAFNGAANLTSVPAHVPSTINNLNTTFSGASIFNDPNVSKWDVANVTNMGSMFTSAKEFNQNLNSWNVSNVTDMSFMFNSASKFNQPLDKWNTSKLTNAYGLFFSAVEFNQPLNTWNVSNVTDMSFMFVQNSKFNQPLDKWDTSKVTNMYNMFGNDVAFNQPLNSWNVSNVTNMASMFNGASIFNQPLDKWNTTKVTNMDSMFNNAYDFNQPLNTWDTTQVTTMTNLFSRTKYFNQTLDKWNTAKVTDMSGMFAYNTAMNTNLSGWDTTALIAGSNFAPASFPTAYLPPKTTKAAW